MALTESEAKSPLSGLSAFKKFQAGIKDRCDELPVVRHVTEIGSYSPEKKIAEQKSNKEITI
ncbi:MAG: hypothetical protein WKG06_29400 [Segetibacter sp.]